MYGSTRSPEDDDGIAWNTLSAQAPPSQRTASASTPQLGAELLLPFERFLTGKCPVPASAGHLLHKAVVRLCPPPQSPRRRRLQPWQVNAIDPAFANA